MSKDLRKRPWFQHPKDKYPLSAKIEFLKRHENIAKAYFEGHMKSAGQELGRLLVKELGYSKRSYWLDIVGNKEDLYKECQAK